MARRCFHGLAVFLVAGCATPEKSADVQGRITDGGSGRVGRGAGADLAGQAAAPSDLSLGRGGCVDGGMCTTSDPGSCGNGHVVCSGLVASCVPDVTTQRCYTGPAGTVNVGICKAGMQTCIGTLGSCDGQVTPAAVENCFNDLDDDCDGVVNNGCPDHLVTGTPVTLTAQGNASGGGPFSLRCPANAYVTKIVVYGDNTDSFVGGLDLACASATLVRGASSYNVTPTPVTPNPASAHANNITTSASQAFDCGTTSFNPGAQVPGLSEAGGVDALGMSCSAGSLTLSAQNQLSITFTKGPNTGAYGYNFGSSFEDDCAAGQVLVGFDGRDGNWFDDVQPVCAPLTVVYK